MVENGQTLSTEEQSLVKQIEAYKTASVGAKKGKGYAAELNMCRSALSIWQNEKQIEQEADNSRSARQLLTGILTELVRVVACSTGCTA